MIYETAINQEINAIYLASNEAQHGGAFATSRPVKENPERYPRPCPSPPIPFPLDHALGKVRLLWWTARSGAGKDLLFAIICNNFREQSGPSQTQPDPLSGNVSFISLRWLGSNVSISFAQEIRNTKSDQKSKKIINKIKVRKLQLGQGSRQPHLK